MSLLFGSPMDTSWYRGSESPGILVFQEPRRVSKLLWRVLCSPSDYVSIPSCPGEVYRLTVGKLRVLCHSFPPFGVVVYGDRYLPRFRQAGRVPAYAGCFPTCAAHISSLG